MKKKLIYILILCAALLFSGSYYSNGVDEQLSVIKESEITEELSDEVTEILEYLGIDDFNAEKLVNISFIDLIKLVYKSFMLKIKEPFFAVLTITGAALICALTQSFCENFSETGTVINAVSSLSAAAAALVPVKDVIDYAANTIEECSNFMVGFIPIYSSLITASGYVSSGTGFRTLMLTASAAISRIASEIIVPLIMIYLALCIAGSISAIDMAGISKTVKNFATWIMVGMMTVFSGIMGLGTLITSSADGAFTKTVKFLVGSSVPVIGSSISDAFSAVKGCLTVTKSLLGTYGILVIAVIFLPPIISLIVWKLCLSAVSGIGGIFGNKNLEGLLSSTSAVLGIMLSLTVLTAVTFIFSVAIMLITGGGM